jgi:type I site-specific restriction endonuclease
MEGMLNKKDLSETDICAKCITPAVIQAGWDEAAQIRREVGFTKGRIIVRGKKEPRYYQRSAINAAVEAIAKGQNRILLVMATGTGKTYTAFQIIWRLWKAGQKKRILFLADRNVLIDQTMVNDFRPFGAAMAKLSTGANTIERDDGQSLTLPTAIDHRRRIDTAYEIYLGLYQAITGPEERQKLFREFSPGFFDLIVIDECHRGSTAEDSAWREILEYFASATQIGLTATPRETAYISNMHYFGPPVYTYSLKQGIRDGFLAPYKVIKVHLDVDVEGYRPRPGELDQQGHEIDDRLYNQKDFDRHLVIDARTQRVAKWVSDHLKQSGDRFQKTIVFCVDTEHAAPYAPGIPQRKPGYRPAKPPLRHAHHRRRRRRHRSAWQLHRSRSHLPGDRHHLAPALHGCGCPDLPPDRARPRSRLHD